MAGLGVGGFVFDGLSVGEGFMGSHLGWGVGGGGGKKKKKTIPLQPDVTSP